MNENREPQRLYDVPEEIGEALKSSEFTQAYFWGQTRFFLTKEIYNKIGRDTLLELAEQVYGEEVIQEFMSTIGEYNQAFSIELPPMEGYPRTVGQTDPRLEQLKQLIYERIN